MRQPTDLHEAYGYWRRVLGGERVPITLDEDAKPGWYRLRLERGGPWRGVVIWIEQKIDRETGELLTDEVIRARLDGEDVPVSRVWPYCAHRAVGTDEFAHLLSAAHAPAREIVRGRIDPLSVPMAF